MWTWTAIQNSSLSQVKHEAGYGQTFRLTRSLGTLFFLFVLMRATEFISIFPAAAPISKIENAADIRYNKVPPSNAITKLQKQISNGRTKLEFQADQGYLKSVLNTLHIPISSQVLVFSKTSVQKDLISPQQPRALYFNDDVYVGYVPTALVLEISTQDPKLGPVYYNLLQREKPKPAFFRNISQCMECHGAKNPGHVPIHLFHSVYADTSGSPFPDAPVFQTTESSLFKDRWGGWYVTGKSGKQFHSGNSTAVRNEHKVWLDPSIGSNKTDLNGLFDTTQYLGASSDIPALLVLAHQLHVQNLISEINYATYGSDSENPNLDGTVHSSRTNRFLKLPSKVKSLCDLLVDTMFFKGETRLAQPVSGITKFTEEFQARGPFDDKKRTLRQFDLTHRLFRYPFSYTIYSEAFSALPSPARIYICHRIWRILTGSDRTARNYISHADRKSIMEILSKTKSDFSAWKN